MRWTLAVIYWPSRICGIKKLMIFAFHAEIVQHASVHSVACDGDVWQSVHTKLCINKYNKNNKRSKWSTVHQLRSTDRFLSSSSCVARRRRLFEFLIDASNISQYSLASVSGTKMLTLHEITLFTQLLHFRLRPLPQCIHSRSVSSHSPHMDWYVLMKHNRQSNRLQSTQKK